MSVETIGIVASNSTYGVIITAPGATNTKGAYAEVVASTAGAATGMVVVISTGGNDSDGLFDIATGAASSEVDIVSNQFIRHQNSNTNQSHVFYYPVAIAAGTRVAMRRQATSTTASMTASIYLLNETQSKRLDTCTAVTYGAATGDSGGTSVDPGGTASTKGSYSQITATTSADIHFVTVMVGHADNNNALTSCYWSIDIATGAAASESIVIADIRTQVHTGSRINSAHFFGPFPVYITSGTRLAARAQCSTNDATGRLIDVIVTGYTATLGLSGGGGAHFSASFM